MEKSRTKQGTTTTTTDANNAVNTVHAERKRMLLSEVYVHKVRKLNTEPSPDGGDDDDGDRFDVFHIFEFADDPTTKITPKLSTNCTEPRKIIDVLRNRTGSDAPQLQRLIEKLSAQHKKWSEIHQKEPQNPTTAVSAPPAASTTPPVVATVADTNAPLDGRDHIYNKRTGTLPAARVNSINRIAPTMASVSAPTIAKGIRGIRPSNVPNMPPNRSNSIESTIIKTEAPPPPPAQRTILVKPIESLNGANQIPGNRPKLQAVAKKSVTVARVPNGAYRKIAPAVQSNSNVMQPQQQPRPAIHRITRMPNPITTSSVAPAAVAAPVCSATIIQPKLQMVKQKPANAVQQPPAPPVKLWNNMMPKAAKEPLRIHVSVKTRETRQDSSDATFSLEVPQEGPIDSDASNGASTLKIGQVFESVDEDDMVDLLQMVPSPSSQPVSEPTPPPQSPPPLMIQSVHSSASPMLDTLVKEVAHDVQSNDKNGMLTAYLNDDTVKLVKIVQNGDKSCADFRCNTCLTFNDSHLQYREHMLQEHGCKVICERCHEAFNHQQAFINHLKLDGVPGARSMKCSLSPNANRFYICIVEPPIILMRNEKVFAFRCKYCDLAFENQRAYVQHAQRHARLFRCKKCPTKPLNIDLMREHLTHHKN